MAKITTEDFINAVSILHNNFYDYSKVTYTGANNKIEIGCPVHGYFYQEPRVHKSGAGCKLCGNKKIGNSLLKDTEEVLKQLNFIHSNRYTYPNFINTGNRDKIKIICKKHGKFEQRLNKHSQGHGCPKCATKLTVSKPEKELFKFIKGIYKNAIQSNKSMIYPYELDIFVPELNKAIEFNGTYWHYHNDHFVPGKHAKKSNMCKEKGIKLLYVREDLWNKDREKMKTVIKNFLRNGNRLEHN